MATPSPAPVSLRADTRALRLDVTPITPARRDFEARRTGPSWIVEDLLRSHSATRLVEGELDLTVLDLESRRFEIDCSDDVVYGHVGVVAAVARSRRCLARLGGERDLRRTEVSGSGRR